MKTLRFVVLVACLSMPHSSASAQAGSPAARWYSVALAPGLPKEKGDEIFRASIEFVLKRTQPGDHVEFLDAVHFVRLAEVAIPQGAARDRAYSREFQGKFGTLKKFLTEPALDDPRLAGQLRVPQLLDAVAKSRRAGERTTLVLIGSPLFITTSANEEAFNMDRGLTPSDGMVACSSSESLFGTAERRGQLNGLAIHWLTPDDRWAISEMHRAAVLRFWTVFTGEQGAALVAVSSDIGGVFDRVVRGEDRPLMAAKADPNDRGLIMRPPPVFQRETVAAPPAPRVAVPSRSLPEAAKPKPTPVPPPVLPAPQVTAPVRTPPAAPLVAPQPAPVPPPLVQQPKPEPAAKPIDAFPPAAPAIKEIPKAAAGHIGIAAIWQVSRRSSQNADIDLYVAASPGGTEVYWNHPHAQGATYFRDIRQAGEAKPREDWQTSWEYVEVSHAEISKVSLWLNVYDTSSPITGIVRVQFEGRVVDKAFRFDVSRGNKGNDNRMGERRRSRYWQQVCLEEMIAAAPSDPSTRLNPR